MDGGTAAGAQGTALPACAMAAAELGDLKRIRDARGEHSLAVRGFRAAWSRLVGGEDAAAVAGTVAADALAASRLGGIDAAVLADAGVGDPRAVLQRGFDDAAGLLPAATRARLRPQAGLAPAWSAPHSGTLPAFVAALAAQPRAGATSPGKPRLILEPPENHADHCLVVAVLGVMLCDSYDADPATVFLAGLAHHLHNAALPDSGFAGEMLLGDDLVPAMQRLFAREIATLPAALGDQVRAALATIQDADNPEGRAFHAADVIDRVLQMRHYEQVAGFTARYALDDLELVHAGPVQAFHQSVLAEAGLP